MLIITSRIPTHDLPVRRVLPRLIQSFFYHCLPEKEHEGYRHSSGKIFKSLNFDFTLYKGELRIRFRALNPEYEKIIAMEVLKHGLHLGEIHFVDTTVAMEDHLIEENEVQLSGFVGCAVLDVFGKKLWLEPRDSRYMEMLRTNVLQRYETFFDKPYAGEFEMALTWQGDKYKNFYYGNHTPFKAWKATWKLKAETELINMILSAGMGSKTMNAGLGMVSVWEEKNGGKS